MTALVWDAVGDHRYETGIDRGVLYLPNAVVWNGLVSVVENRGRDLKPYYLEGAKYLDHSVPSAYSGKVQAFTYPDEFEAALGNQSVAAGVTLYDQPGKRFHLSYRTRIGNDLEGVDYGYKIHLVYNVTAIPGDTTFGTIAGSVSASPFEWELRGVPNWIDGFRAIGHISLNSRLIDPEMLSDLEDRLYGTSTTAPAMPTQQILLDLVTA